MEEQPVFQSNAAPTQATSVASAQTDTALEQHNPPQSFVPEKTSSIGKILKLLLIFLLIIGGIIGFILVIIPKLSHPQSQKVTLTWWGLWEDPQIVNSVIADFQRANPNITVKYSKEDPKQYSDRLLARIPDGNGPDIFRYHNSWVPMIKSILAPLPNDVITKETFTKTYYPVMQQDLISNGAIYGIPLEVDTLSLFVNNTLFQAAGTKVPTTWTDFINTARALTVKDANGTIKTAGAALGTYDNITHASDIISLLFAQNGADMFKLATTKQNAGDALTFYSSFTQGDGNVWDNSLNNSIVLFGEGKLGMYFGYSWDIFTIKAENPQLDFSIYPVPHLPQRDMTIASYWVEGVSAKTPHPKEATLFMKFLAQKDTQQKLFAAEAKTRLFGEPYARVDQASLLKSNQLLYPFVQQAQNAQSTFFASDTYNAAINAQMNGYLANAIRSILTNTSPDSAIDTISAGVAQILQQYGQ